MATKGSTKKTNRPDHKRGIIRRRMRGESLRTIAKAEGMAVNTVMRILTLPEVQQAIACGRSKILQNIEDLSERAVKIALGKTKATSGERTLIEMLRGIGVLTAKVELSTMGEVGQPNYSSVMVRYYYKHGRWPTEQEAIDFLKTIDVEPLVKGALPSSLPPNTH